MWDDNLSGYVCVAPLPDLLSLAVLTWGRK